MRSWPNIRPARVRDGSISTDRQRRHRSSVPLLPPYCRSTRDRPSLPGSCQAHDSVIRPKSSIPDGNSVAFLVPVPNLLPGLCAKITVGVGIMIAHSPLHGSGQAGFPHPALALGDDAHATERVGMTDGRHRQPASDEAPHAIPEDAAVLAAPRKSAMPKPSYLESKKSQRRVVHGHSVIPDVSTHHRLPPLALFGDGFVHTSLKFGLHLVQF